MVASPEWRQRPNTDAKEAEKMRRGRYTRLDGAEVPLALTPIKVQILYQIFACRLLSLPQLASLLALSDQSARRHLRELFDGGLVDRVAVSRVALSNPEEPNDATLLHGSAPSIHVISRLGVQRLIDAGILNKDALKRPIPMYGPQNALFLRHELMVRDVRVWLEELVREAPTIRKSFAGVTVRRRLSRFRPLKSR